MTYTGIMATMDEIKAKAGNGASTTAVSEEFLNQFAAEAESFVNVLTRTDFSASYSTLTNSRKMILKEAVSNLAAIYVVQYDTAGYASLREAENIMNTNWARFVQVTSLMRDQKQVSFMEETA